LPCSRWPDARRCRRSRAPTSACPIGIDEPGVYGRVDLGNAAPPPVVHPRPVVIAPAPYAVRRAPICLYVAAEQQSHWRHCCARYDACGQPVYFVSDAWVRDRWEHAHHRPWREERHR